MGALLKITYLPYLPLIMNKRQGLSSNTRKSVLNQLCHLSTVAPLPTSKDSEISVNTLTFRQVANAIRSLKNGKTIRIDAIHNDTLFTLQNMCWNSLPLFPLSVGTRRNTRRLKEGFDSENTKKGDISVGDNSRGKFRAKLIQNWISLKIGLDFRLKIAINILSK